MGLDQVVWFIHRHCPSRLWSSWFCYALEGGSFMGLKAESESTHMNDEKYFWISLLPLMIFYYYIITLSNIFIYTYTHSIIIIIFIYYNKYYYYYTWYYYYHKKIIKFFLHTTSHSLSPSFLSHYGTHVTHYRYGYIPRSRPSFRRRLLLDQLWEHLQNVICPSGRC